MAVSEQNKPIVDKAILRVLNSNRTRFGLTVEAIRIHCGRFGVDPTADDVLDRLDYLEIKELAEEVLKGIHQAERSWRITSPGITWLEERGG